METLEDTRTEEHRDLSAFEQRVCLSYWYPKTSHLPSPATEIVESPLTPGMLARDNAEDKASPELGEMVWQVRNAAEKMMELYGTPLFLRTGQTSGKHDWDRTCYLKDPMKTERHVRALAQYSHMVDLMGLPLDVWCIREWLNIEHKFTAFEGMPVGKEYRFFCQEKELVHAQPYWPPESVERHSNDPDWEAMLDDLNEMPPPYGAIDIANLVAAAISERFDHPGSCWSVDVCKTEDRGWMLTDMSPAERSYFWDPDGEHDSLRDKLGIEINVPSN